MCKGLLGLFFIILHLCYLSWALFYILTIWCLFVSAKLIPANQQGEIQGVVTHAPKLNKAHGPVTEKQRIVLLFVYEMNLLGVCTSVHMMNCLWLHVLQAIYVCKANFNIEPRLCACECVCVFVCVCPTQVISQKLLKSSSSNLARWLPQTW